MEQHMSERWILIVEDDTELGSAYAEVLDMTGLRTQLVRDGRAALNLLADAKPDLVLLDLHLPEVSGPAVLDYIRSDERLQATRVVIVSADIARAEYLKEQADLVLVKPVGFNDIFGLAQRFFS
jgi:two-component system, OmpR family, phosphate regulon response regulator PhoB